MLEALSWIESHFYINGAFVACNKKSIKFQHTSSSVTGSAGKSMKSIKLTRLSQKNGGQNNSEYSFGNKKESQVGDYLSNTSQ
jgi:hypothetical protein